MHLAPPQGLITAIITATMYFFFPNAAGPESLEDYFQKGAL